jgi:hypothetical protein
LHFVAIDSRVSRIVWQWLFAQSDLCDDQNPEKDLTENQPISSNRLTEDSQLIFNLPEPAKPHRGRRDALDDSTLENRRHRLVSLFEASWGEIGWELQKCKKAGDLVSIFSAIAGAKFQDVLTVFCNSSTLPASRVAWRKALQKLKALVGPQSDSANLSREASDRLQRARAALAQAKGRNRKVVRKEFVRCKREADEREKESRRIYEQQRDLAAHLSLLEASIARRELFRFLKSKRYELNPLNLASAAAGLPEMGCRRSALKCAKFQRPPAEGLPYEIFKAIRYLMAKTTNKTAQALVEHFREGVRSLPQRYSRSRVELAEKWLFLERALRQTWRVKPHPGAFPFEITARYFRHTQLQSHTDILLAERAKLRIEKRTDHSQARGAGSEKKENPASTVGEVPNRRIRG